MGRKGIGKLSLFSIADLIEIRTKAAGRDGAGLRIVSSDLRTAMQSGRAEYNPQPIDIAEGALPAGHGTRISVSLLKRNRLRLVGHHLDRRRAVGQVHGVGHRDNDLAGALEGFSRVRGADVVHQH